MRLGMIGHFDSGKTATADALARLELATIVFDTPAANVEDWLKQGAPVDGLLLVVSVMDGPMPGTRRHLEWAAQAGIQPVGVWINKMDMYDRGPELVEIIEMETRDLMASYGLEDEEVPFGVGSSRLALRELAHEGPGEQCNHLTSLLEDAASYMTGR